MMQTSGSICKWIAGRSATLKVARYCQQELSQYRGVRVVMIRESESCPYNSTSSYCLNQRVKDAKMPEQIFM